MKAAAPKVESMPRCERCRDPSGEFFGNDGTSLCKRCFYADDTAARELRAAEAVVEEFPEPLQKFVTVRPNGVARQATAPSPPGTMLRNGVGVLLGSMLLTAGCLYWGVAFEIPLCLVGVGFVMTVRGYKLRHYV